MNIDRPLDEIIQESRVQRRAERAAARRKATKVSGKQPSTSNPSLPSNPKPPTSTSPESRPNNQPKLGPSKKRHPISKSQKRRVRTKNRPQVSSSDLDRDDDPSPNRVSREESEGRRENGGGGVTDRLSMGKAGRASGIAAKGVKVAVSNLHPGVTEMDIKELFETVGPLRRATLKTYGAGESLCEAEVVFEVMPDALEAIKRYNLVPLDNQPLHITLATDSVPGNEGVHSRIGRGRGRGGPRKRNSPPRARYDDADDGSEGGGGYANGISPREERAGGGPSQGRRFNNRRRFRRF